MLLWGVVLMTIDRSIDRLAIDPLTIDLVVVVDLVVVPTTTIQYEQYNWCYSGRKI